MKFKMEVTGVSTNGDNVTVIAQGRNTTAAQWRNDLAWKIEVPMSMGNALRIGQMLTIEIRP